MTGNGKIAKASIGVRFDPIFAGYFDDQLTEGTICVNAAAVGDFLTATQVYGQRTEVAFDLTFGKPGHHDQPIGITKGKGAGENV